MIQEAPAPQPAAAVVTPAVEPVAQPVAVPEAPGKVGPAKPWMAQLKGHLQANEVLSRFEDFSSVAEKVLEFEGKRDRLIEIPDQDASDEIKAKWKAARGVASKVDEITFTLPQLPAGLQFVEADVAGFRQWAFDNELTPKQAQAALELDTARQVKSYQEAQARRKAAADQAAAADNAIDQQLKSEWREHYQINREKAKANVGKLFSPAFVDAMAKAGVLDSALAAKEFHALEARLGDTPFLRGGNPAGTGGKGPIRGLDNVNSVKTN